MNFTFLSGLPRTGSTLLSSILSQNPKIHAEGNSAVCQLMWDMFVSSHTSANQQLVANHREDTISDLISSIPKIYYKNVSSKIVIDKCRSWTLEPNIDLIHRYITDNPKFIVMIRPIDEILKSFARLMIDNNKENVSVDDYLTPESEPVMRSLDGVLNVLSNHRKKCLIVTYNDLVSNTKETINKIYDFCEWENYDHDFNHIVNKFSENDEVYGLLGQHNVRTKISKREIKIELSRDVLLECKKLNKLIGV
jgi:sulfotransferase